jgi:hypothetical protein
MRARPEGDALRAQEMGEQARPWTHKASANTAATCKALVK